jgi:hypothetical protein
MKALRWIGESLLCVVAILAILGLIGCWHDEFAAGSESAGEVLSAPLSPFDFDDDGDIDLRDFAAFQNIYDLDDFAVFHSGFTGP